MVKDYDKLTKLEQLIYDRDIKKCDNCKSFIECTQDTKGIQPIITSYEFNNTTHYKLAAMECKLKPTKIYGNYEKTIRTQNCTILSSKQKSLANKLYKAKMGYVYGPAGQGKTTVLQCLVKKYSERKVITMFELAINVTNKLKDFDNNTHYMELLQQVPILFIDDFAREQLTTWTISNIWIPILQFRLDNNKPTFISSNYDLIQLYTLIAKLRDNVTSDMLIDRIKGYMLVEELKDKNYRLGVKI